MRINLISALSEESTIEAICTPNQVYAWFLRKAFAEEDTDVRLISEGSLHHELPPETDHTLVVSATTYGYTETLEKLRASTTGKLARYMNADKLRGDRCFDYCFTQIGPVSYRPEKYVYAGWGVDPTHSYPEQGERAAFLDSKDLRPRSLKRLGKAYQIYDDVLSKEDIITYNPVSVYNKSQRLSYPDYQATLRKCHYFLCTQIGDGGLNRLEAAACGALLVVPERLYRNRTMSLLNHRVWSTEEELTSILREEGDIEANRRRALEHRWEDVVKRIIGVLENE